MSAETLRRAASLMRSRAETATPGPWQVGQDVDSGQRFIYDERWTELAEVAEWSRWLGNAAHIASWPPVVALAVADWLEGVTKRHAPVDNAWNVGQPCCMTCGLDLEGDDRGHCDDFADALAVARAYLGSES